MLRKIENFSENLKEQRTHPEKNSEKRIILKIFQKMEISFIDNLDILPTAYEVLGYLMKYFHFQKQLLLTLLKDLL